MAIPSASDGAAPRRPHMMCRMPLPSPVILAITAAIAISACAPPASVAVDTSAEEATLKGVTSMWFDAYNAGDVETMVALYADDAVLMPAHAAVARGRDAIRSYLKSELAAAKAAGIQLVQGNGTAGVTADMGWESGSYSVVDAASKALDTGSYLSVARKVDGRWRLIRDIYNSDRPLPAVTPRQ
jgi:uncharacterized protein (TIGR02246 family)